MTTHNPPFGGLRALGVSMSDYEKAVQAGFWITKDHGTWKV